MKQLNFNGPEKQQGSTMVEFAIISPLGIMFVLGIVQLGLMYTAKEVVNEAAFLGARAGAIQHAQVDKMAPAITKGLLPFYQDATTSNNYARLAAALLKANLDLGCYQSDPCPLRIDVVSPNVDAFTDFGVTSKAMAGHTFIPNDNLEYRQHSFQGSASGLSIQDANVLKIKVTYGYELKVPLMKTVMKAIMCSVDSGIDAFGRSNSTVPDTTPGNCTNYYSKGLVPIVTYATVQMQSPAWAKD